MVRHLFIGMMLATGSAEIAHAALVPFVGCPSDGQQGPQPAPKTGKTPAVASSAAPKLAYYATIDGVGVLAPRGWHCFGSLGSNGMGIMVSPRQFDSKSALRGRARTGPAVNLFQTSGATSGRLEVAEVAARLFPAAHSYVAKVRAEGFFDKPLRFTPYPDDRLSYRGKYQLLYTTPANRSGLGTRGGLAPDALPIDGIEWLHPDSDMDLTSLAVRLPKAQRPLVAEIIKGVTADR